MYGLWVKVNEVMIIDMVTFWNLDSVGVQYVASKFEVHLQQHWISDTFFDCIREVYSASSDATAIRKVLVDVVSLHKEELVRKRPFQELIREVGDFAVDLVLKLTISNDWLEEVLGVTGARSCVEFDSFQVVAVVLISSAAEGRLRKRHGWESGIVGSKSWGDVAGGIWGHSFEGKSNRSIRTQKACRGTQFPASLAIE
jgi:hypothetical protein